MTTAPSASPVAAGAPADTTAAHYRAPEAVRSPTRPSGKWDVYSFGVLLLELVAGRALTSLELCQCAAEEQALRVVDPALRGEMVGREEAVASCLRLGAACCAMAPSKMSSIRDVLQATERMPDLAAAVAASCTSSSASTTAHHHQ